MPRNRDYYDEFADWIRDHRYGGYDELVDDLESDLVRNYVVGSDVLEVGCGRGVVLRRIDALANLSVGVDIDRGRLMEAANHGLDVARADARALPFEAGRFDVVCSCQMLAHLPETGRALREMVRVTKPGGHLLLEFYNPISLRYFEEALLGRRSADGEPVHWHTPAAIRRQIPSRAELIDFAGIHVVAPGSFVHWLPWVRHWVRQLEFIARDSPLKYFGGFLIAIVRKEETASRSDVS